MIGYKFAWTDTGLKVIVKLETTPRAKIIQPIYTNKFRTNRAKVLSIHSFNTGRKIKETIAYSDFDRSFKYQVGKVVTPDDLDEDVSVFWGHGIYFHPTIAEAHDYGNLC